MGQRPSRVRGTCRARHSVVAEPVRAIVVKAQSGDIDLIHTSTSISVRETQHYDATRPRFTQQVTGGVLTIESDCNKAQCEVDLQVTATDAQAVDARTQSGNVSVAARNPQRVAARTQSGNVAVTVPKGEYAIDASTGSGTLNIDGIARNDRAPKSIDARTTSGNVSLRAG